MKVHSSLQNGPARAHSIGLLVFFRSLDIKWHYAAAITYCPLAEALALATCNFL